MNIENLKVEQLKQKLKEQNGALNKAEKAKCQIDDFFRQKASLKVAGLSFKGIDAELSKLPNEKEVEYEITERSNVIEKIENRIKTLETREAGQKAFNEFKNLVSDCQKTKDTLQPLIEKLNSSLEAALSIGKNLNISVKRNGHALSFDKTAWGREVGNLQTTFKDYGLQGQINMCVREGSENIPVFAMIAKKQEGSAFQRISNGKQAEVII